MKTIKFYSLIFFFSLYHCTSIFAQSSGVSEETWTGTFMDQFEVRIKLTTLSDNESQGFILMFAGSESIQNDPLTEIVKTEKTLSFLIPVKSTRFEGVFSKEKDQVTGFFTFPDNSKHPLSLRLESIGQQNPQSAIHEKIPRKYLADDIKSLVKIIDEIHPDPYFYTSKEVLLDKSDYLISQLKDSMSVSDFYFQIASITDLIKCSHTGMRPPSKVLDNLQQGNKYFPLKMYADENKVFYIAGNTANPNLQPGAVLEEINGQSMDNIREQIYKIIPVEGYNKTTKLTFFNNYFNEYLAFLIPADSFKVKFSNRNRQGFSQFIIRAIDYNNGRDINLFRDNQAAYTFTIDDNIHTGILHIPSFAIQNINSYISSMDSIFKSIKTRKLDNLIIDLRNNEGGHPIFAAQLLSYLIPEEFTYFTENKNIEEFKPLYQPMQSNEYCFKGTIYIVVNGGSLSTTGHLISLLKYHTNAIFVGEEPGSNFYCNDFSRRFNLPASEIQLNIPTERFTTAVNGFSRLQNFNVDYPVKKCLDSVLNKEDDEINFIKDLIKNKNL